MKNEYVQQRKSPKYFWGSNLLSGLLNFYKLKPGIFMENVPQVQQMIKPTNKKQHLQNTQILLTQFLKTRNVENLRKFNT